MEFIREIIEIMMHIDKYLDLVIRSFENWSYLLFFIIIFAMRALTAIGSFNLLWLFIALAGAAIIGDSVYYNARFAVFGVTLMISGFQILFSSFYISFLEVKKEHEDFNYLP